MAAAGTAVLLYTSELEEVQLTCDRAVVKSHGGRVVAEMTAGDADEPALMRAAHGLPLSEAGTRAAVGGSDHGGFGMSTTSAPAAGSLSVSPSGSALARFVRRNSWVLALWVLLGAMLAFTVAIQPGSGAPQLIILSIAALPYAFATAGQAMAVIIGGIDLSVAAMMTLTSVSAAVLMEGQGEEFGIVAVAATLLLGLGLGTVNGLSVVLTRVPDIVVTLSFFFIWEGAALLILDAPGGSASTWLRDLIIGPVGSFVVPVEVGAWLPKALLLLVLGLGVVWICSSARDWGSGCTPSVPTGWRPSAAASLSTARGWRPTPCAASSRPWAGSS